jgi:hypothetical protein
MEWKNSSNLDKVIIIPWMPNDATSSFSTQIQVVDHPFMVNATISNCGGRNTTSQ